MISATAKQLSTFYNYVTIQRRVTKPKYQVLYLTTLIYGLFYLCRLNFGFAIVGIQKDLNLLTVHTGILSAVMLLAYGATQPLSGWLCDKYQPSRMILIGGILSALCNFILGYSSTFLMLAILVAFNSFFQALAFPSGAKIIANWCDKKEIGRAFGLYLLASGCSSVLTYAICIKVLANYDWQMLFIFPSFILAFATLIFYYFIQDKPLISNKVTISNQLTGQNKGNSTYSLFSTIKSKELLLGTLSFGFNNIAKYGLIIWLPVYYLSINSLQQEYVSMFVAIGFPVGMAIGSYVCGMISDQYFNSNRSLPITLFMSMTAIICLLLYLNEISSSGYIFIFLFVLGMFISGPQTTLFALCADISGNKSTGLAIGIMNAVGYAFAACGEILIGLAVNYYNNDLSLIFLILASSAIISAALAFPIRR